MILALIDTNLLLLWVVGQAGPTMIRDHRRLSSFDETDFELLSIRLSQFSGFATIPNIVTEASNLLPIEETGKWAKASIRLREYASSAREIYISSREVSEKLEFLRFGLTDVAIMIAGLRERNRMTILTVDYALLGYLEKQLKLKTLNLRHDRNIGG